MIFYGGRGDNIQFITLLRKDDTTLIAGKLKHCFVPCYYPGATLRQTSADVTRGRTLYIKGGYSKQVQEMYGVGYTRFGQA